MTKYGFWFYIYAGLWIMLIKCSHVHTSRLFDHGFLFFFLTSAAFLVCFSRLLPFPLLFVMRLFCLIFSVLVVFCFVLFFFSRSFWFYFFNSRSVVCIQTAQIQTTRNLFKLCLHAFLLFFFGYRTNYNVLQVRDAACTSTHTLDFQS